MPVVLLRSLPVFLALLARASLADEVQPKPAAPAAASPEQPEELSAAIERCVNSLPSAGGDCDIGRLSGRTELLMPVRITKNNVRLRLPAGTFKMSANARFEIVGSGISLEGAGRNATTLVPAGSGLLIGSGDTISRRWRVRGLSISGSAGGGTAIRLENAREGRIDEVIVSSFRKQGSAAIEVQGNCWTVVADDLTVVGNLVGVSFAGGNANAWVFRTANLSSNDVGVRIDIGRSSAHGLLFTDGTHFEENVTAGIQVFSGDVHGLSITDPYVELRAGQRLIMARRAAKVPLRLFSFTYSGGFVTTDGAPVIELDSRGGPEDSISATLTSFNVFQRAGEGPVILVSGARARVVVSGGVFSKSGGPVAEIDGAILTKDGASSKVLK